MSRARRPTPAGRTPASPPSAGPMPCCRTSTSLVSVGVAALIDPHAVGLDRARPRRTRERHARARTEIVQLDGLLLGEPARALLDDAQLDPHRRGCVTATHQGAGDPGAARRLLD